VRDGQWSIVEWMWQAYRNDMAHLLTVPGRPELPPDHWIEAT
jgi:hypothetical protein